LVKETGGRPVAFSAADSRLNRAWAGEIRARRVNRHRAADFAVAYARYSFQFFATVILHTKSEPSHCRQRRIQLEVPVCASPGDGRIVADHCAHTIITDWHMNGFTFPGMIELPGYVAGSWISPMPQRGPLPSQRISFAILNNLTEIVFRWPLASTTASFPPCAWKWFFAS
jgi:hypothetical protein